MTPTEIRAYQTSFPLRCATNQMRYVPRCYRESNVPYEGVKNPIPLERMKDPETGDFYPRDEIKVSRPARVTLKFAKYLEISNGKTFERK